MAGYYPSRQFITLRNAERRALYFLLEIQAFCELSRIVAMQHTGTFFSLLFSFSSLITVCTTVLQLGVNVHALDAD